MKSVMLLMFLSVCFLCCSTNKAKVAREPSLDKCTQIEVMEIADSAVKELRYDIKTLDKKIMKNDKAFVVQYLPKDTLTRGGGAEIIISKGECKIIDVKRYQ